jgi:hypothetical protein
MKIIVVAHAIQEDGFADADEAWDAFEGEPVPTTEDPSIAKPDGN